MWFEGSEPERECVSMGMQEKWCREKEDRGRDNSWSRPNPKPAWVSVGAQAAFVQYLLVFSTPRELMWIYEGWESATRDNMWLLSTSGAPQSCFKSLIWPDYWFTVHTRDVHFPMVKYLTCGLLYAILRYLWSICSNCAKTESHYGQKKGLAFIVQWHLFKWCQELEGRGLWERRWSSLWIRHSPVHPLCLHNTYMFTHQALYS